MLVSYFKISNDRRSSQIAAAALSLIFLLDMLLQRFHQFRILLLRSYRYPETSFA